VNRERIKAYLGIDVGSISTNLAVIDENGRLLSKRYLMTAGRPIEGCGATEAGNEVGDKAEILGGHTGSGRYRIADCGADIKNEITARVTAARFIDRDVDTVRDRGTKVYIA
jgi:activator of 2-hydroxyglutaryl-CoA dehydratase